MTAKTYPRFCYRLIQLVLFVAVLLLHPRAQPAQTAAALDRSAQRSGEYAPGVVLVGLRAPASGPDRLSRMGDAAYLTGILRRRGWAADQLGAPRTLLADEATSIQALSVTVGSERAAVDALRRDPQVAFAELDYAIHVEETQSPDAPNDPGWPNQWAPPKIQAPSAWQVTTGTPNVVIAVVDTGVQLDHEDLVGSLWTNPGEIADNGVDDDGNGKTDDVWGWRFYHEWDGDAYLPREDNQVTDDHGHGTHVAGIASAVVDNGVGIAGVAGGARVMPVKVLDGSGTGWHSDLARGIAYAVDEGARIVNLSLGDPNSSATLQAAVDYAHTHGALTVAAAGNGGKPVLYPAACDHALGVSATNQDDHRWYDTNHGPEVDVAAPGVSIYSTGWTGECSSGYCYKSGSSMATPHVAGLAALLWSERPDLTSAQVVEAITSTALDVNADTYPGRDDYLGWGRIEAAEALSATSPYPVNQFAVGVRPAQHSVTSSVGSAVSHTLTVQNRGTITDTFFVALENDVWKAGCSESSVGPLGIGVSDTLTIQVTVPATAPDGLRHTLTVVLTSAGNPAVSATSQLTIAATWPTHCRRYLPMVHHN